MTRKTILLCSLLLLVLAGVIAAAAGDRLRGAFAGRGPNVHNLPPASTEYARLLRRFRAGDSAIAISGTIRIYDQEHGGLLKEQKPFRFERYGRQYCSQLSYLRTYCDGELVLVVDTVHRMLQVMKAPPVGKDSVLAAMPVDLLFSDTARFKLSGRVEQMGAERMLTLHSDFNPEVKVCRVYYDTVSYVFHRTEVEWWKDQAGLDTAAGKVWLAKIDYTYELSKDIRPGDGLHRYVRTGAGGAITPDPAYSTYQLEATTQPIDQKPNR